jgi:hypothetical protein
MSGVRITRGGRHTALVHYGEESSSSSSSDEEEIEDESSSSSQEEQDALLRLIGRLKTRDFDSSFEDDYAFLLDAWRAAGYDTNHLVLKRPSRIVRNLWPERRQAFWDRVAAWVRGKQAGTPTYESHREKERVDLVVPPPPKMDTSSGVGDDDDDMLTIDGIREVWQGLADDGTLSLQESIDMDGYLDLLLNNLDPSLWNDDEEDKMFYKPTFEALADSIRVTLEDEDLDDAATIAISMLRIIDLIYGPPAQHDPHLAALRPGYVAPSQRQPVVPPKAKEPKAPKTKAPAEPTKTKVWNSYYMQYVQNTTFAHQPHKAIVNAVKNVRAQMQKAANNFPTDPAWWLNGKKPINYELLLELLRRVNARLDLGWVIPGPKLAPLPQEEEVVVEEEDEEPRPMEEVTPKLPTSAHQSALADDSEVHRFQAHYDTAQSLAEQYRSAAHENPSAWSAIMAKMEKLKALRDQWRALVHNEIPEDDSWDSWIKAELENLRQRTVDAKRRYDEATAHLVPLRRALDGNSIEEVALHWADINRHFPMDARKLMWAATLRDFAKHRVEIAELEERERILHEQLKSHRDELGALLQKHGSSLAKAGVIDDALVKSASREEPAAALPGGKRGRGEPENVVLVPGSPPPATLPDSEFDNAVLQVVNEMGNEVRVSAPRDPASVRARLSGKLRHWVGNALKNYRMHTVDEWSVAPEALIALHENDPWGQVSGALTEYFPADDTRVLKRFWKRLQYEWNRRMQTGAARGGESHQKHMGEEAK